MDPARVTVEQLDQELSAAHTAAAGVGSALFELESARDRLTARAPRLTGASAQQWARAQTQIGVLWTWYQAVQATLTGLADERAGGRLRAAEIKTLWGRLTGPTVELPLESMADARRDLPGAAGVGNPASVAAVLRVVNAGYAEAAQTVASLQALDDLIRPRLDGLAHDLTELEERARSAGVRLPNDALRLGSELEAMQGVAGGDPLSVDVDRIPALADAIGQLRTDLDAQVGALVSVGERLGQLDEDLGRLRAALAAAAEVAAEAEAKVGGDHPGSAECARLAGALAQIGGRLEQARALPAGERDQADRLSRQVAAALAEARPQVVAASGAARAPLARRAELRGRLSAYQAKAKRLGLIENYAVDQLHRAAEDELYRAPCDLEVAARRVEAYQAAIVNPRIEDRS